MSTDTLLINVNCFISSNADKNFHVNEKHNLFCHYREHFIPFYVYNDTMLISRSVAKILVLVHSGLRCKYSILDAASQNLLNTLHFLDRWEDIHSSIRVPCAHLALLPVSRRRISQETHLTHVHLYFGGLMHPL